MHVCVCVSVKMGERDRKGDTERIHTQTWLKWYEKPLTSKYDVTPVPGPTSTLTICFVNVELYTHPHTHTHKHIFREEEKEIGRKERRNTCIRCDTA